MQAEKKSAVRGVVLTAQGAWRSPTEQKQNKGAQFNVQGGKTLFEIGTKRVLPKAEAVPLRWPKKLNLANELIAEWLHWAEVMLGSKRLSLATARCIAGHMSRRDGNLIMSNGAISLRTGRSVQSTERDISRLHQLGFIDREFRSGNGRSGRQRALKLTIPATGFAPQRMPTGEPLNASEYVEGLDIGDTRYV